LWFEKKKEWKNIYTQKRQTKGWSGLGTQCYQKNELLKGKQILCAFYQVTDIFVLIN
jgi:hypothetical protein